MATEVLRPQACLIQRLRFPRRRNYQAVPTITCYPSNPKPNRRKPPPPPPPARTDNNSRNRAQSEPSVLRRSSSDPDNLKTSKNVVSMEKVTILKRGESLDSKLNAAAFNRPDSNVYAGSGFVVSPEPSDLPLPSFSKKQQKEEEATRDLRRILGLTETKRV